MKVLGAAVDREGRLVVEVDELPLPSDLRWERRGSIYYAETEDGFASWLDAEGLRPGRGFAGASFELTMKDGERVSLKGPWRCSARDAENAGFPACVETFIRAEGSSQWVAGGLHWEKAYYVVDEFLPGCMVASQAPGEPLRIFREKDEG